VRALGGMRRNLNHKAGPVNWFTQESQFRVKV